ncbi:MAG: winged helix DNA-binding protein [Acidimicrobiales bacterium]
MELFLLGRKLMQLAEDALPQGRLATSVRLVFMDVAFHPGSSISNITERTGFPQSHVSTSVAKLRDLGVLETEVDPADHRRTLVRATPAGIARGASVRSAPIEAVLAPALAGSGASEVGEVVDALELLAQRLTPRALARLGSEVGS